MKINDIPIVGVGPGSQPEQEDDQLNFMPMPKTFDSYRRSKWLEPEEVVHMPAALEGLASLQKALENHNPGKLAEKVDLSHLTADELAFVNETLGEGEVSIVYDGPPVMQIQESIFAGVWRVRKLSSNGAFAERSLEVGEIPSVVRNSSFPETPPKISLSKDDIPPGVLNAPSVLVELIDQSRIRRADDVSHVINLTLLPLSPEDIAYLQKKLGRGTVIILSRGFGNCRITSTALRNVWWVQYFNSMDTLILNTLEVVEVPAVACAAEEDLSDSALRLAEIRESLT